MKILKLQHKHTCSPAAQIQPVEEAPLKDGSDTCPRHVKVFIFLDNTTASNNHHYAPEYFIAITLIDSYFYKGRTSLSKWRMVMYSRNYTLETSPIPPLSVHPFTASKRRVMRRGNERNAQKRGITNGSEAARYSSQLFMKERILQDHNQVFIQRLCNIVSVRALCCCQGR